MSETDTPIEDGLPFRIGAMADLPAELLRALLLSEPLPSIDAEPQADAGLRSMIDWPALQGDADGHAVGVLVYRRLQELGWSAFVDPRVAAQWDADTRHAELQYRLQVGDAAAITQTLSRHGVRHAFLKGPGYRELFYRPAWVRLCGDCDVLVEPRDTELARHLLHQLDFEHAACTMDYQQFRPADPVEIAQTEAQHYELAQLVKSYRLTNPPDWLFGTTFRPRAPFTFEHSDGSVIFRSIVDVHWALHFSLQTEAPLENIATVALADGTLLPILRPEWNLFLTAFKLYYEAFDRVGYGLHHLADLAAMLRHTSDQLDWVALADLVQRHRVEPALFYTLSAAQALAGYDVVPRALLDAWAAISIEPGDPVRELGDFVPAMLRRRVPSTFLAESAFDAFDTHAERSEACHEH